MTSMKYRVGENQTVYNKLCIIKELLFEFLEINSSKELLNPV